MPRKKKTQDAPVVKADVIETSLEDILADRFGRYSKYIIQERALPDARDGLKPVQRRILWSMYEDGNTFSHPYRKSAKTVGNVIGNYHPHGDISVYDALVRLSQDWKMTIPLVDMQGNNGSIDDDPAAAMRYTEARLSELAGTLLEDIDKETVEWAPNFSDEKMEPTILPARYPNLLVNGITGIAAGYATNIPPHNLSEVLEGAIYRLKNPDCSLEELMEIVKGPDFPTGGIVMGKQGIIDAFTGGKGRVLVRAKTSLEQTKTIQQIIITEIPYEVVKSNLVKRMDDIRLNRKVDGILDVRDESDRNGLRIVVDLKKEANAQAILNYLYKNTDLQISYNYNMVAIVSKAPRLLGLREILDAFLEFREEVVIKRSQYDYNKKAVRKHIVEGLIKAISILDDIIAIIRSSRNKADSKKNLMAKYDFTFEQAEAIVTLQLYRLSNTDIKELEAEDKKLSREMEVLQSILSSSKKRHNLMIRELTALKEKFALPRRTLLEEEVEEIVIDPMAMIAKEDVMLTLSRDGYIKRVSMRSWNSSGNAMTGRKEGDSIIAIGQASTMDTLLFFTDKGKCARIPVYKLEESRWKDIGSHFSNYMKTEGAEKIVSAAIFEEMPQNAQFVFVSRKGVIKRIDVQALPNPKTPRAMTIMNLGSQDALCAALYSAASSDQLVLASRNGNGYRFKLSSLEASTPKTRGVNGMKLAADDVLQAACLDTENFVILTSNHQQMKRVALEDIPALKRPAKGTPLFKSRKENPDFLCDMMAAGTRQTLEAYGQSIHEIKGVSIPKKGLQSDFAPVLETPDADFHWISPLQRLKNGSWPKPVQSGTEEPNTQQMMLFGDQNVSENS